MIGVVYASPYWRQIWRLYRGNFHHFPRGCHLGATMEEVEAVFREGVLSHLEQLETLSQNLSAKQEQGRRREDVVQEKREEILRLKKKRDELQARVKQQEEQIRVLSGRAEGSCPPVPSTEEALQDLRLEEMEGAMEALWFTGISGKKTDNGICFCLSTAFEGQYLDSYYIQVHNLVKPLISRHSIPPFIPLGEITKSHLQSDMKKFLAVLSDHLNAFAGRKFQVDRLQDLSDIYIPDTLQRNSLNTVISFRYNVSIRDRTFCFSAKLLYGAVTSVLPTEAQVTCQENNKSAQEAATSHSSMFRSTPLHRVVGSLTT
ncbi:centromere protein O isoform X2 [Hyla sarda]|uniref:centromere protein O isoform X2 n=1 Tax=Hyla sarda TaxID=327740 RepID=UPI0024C38D79|nr:centromere protein O isoform X2 [Hyla sarda]